MSETKFVYTASSTTTDAFLNIMENLMPAIPQGTDRDDRIGNKVKLKFFKFRLFLNLFDSDPGDNNNFCLVRILLFNPKLPYVTASETKPQNEDIYNNPTNILSMVNPQFVNVISDRIICMAVNPSGNAVGLPSAKIIRIKRKYQRNINFKDANSNDITDPMSQIWINIKTDYPNANQITMGRKWHGRFSYMDT